MVSVHHEHDERIMLDEGQRDGGICRRYVRTAPFLFEDEGYKIVLGPKVQDAYAINQEIQHRLYKYGFRENVDVLKSKIRYR